MHNYQLTFMNSELVCWYQRPYWYHSMPFLLVSNVDSYIT